MDFIGGLAIGVRDSLFIEDGEKLDQGGGFEELLGRGSEQSGNPGVQVTALDNFVAERLRFAGADGPAKALEGAGHLIEDALRFIAGIDDFPQVERLAGNGHDWFGRGQADFETLVQPGEAVSAIARLGAFEPIETAGEATGHRPPLEE
jgi:hypothetical protein